MLIAQLLNSASFLISAAKLSQLPADQGIEIAFAGRSNAGKSTALNCLTKQRNLARTSKTPGRTQLINLFKLDDDRRLVDLPGYGYAKVAKTIKQNWQEVLMAYLQQRQCLRGLILLMDSRHPLQDSDLMLINWALAADMPLHILLTKADKLSRSQGLQALHFMAKNLPAVDSLSWQLFSASSGQGVVEAQEKVGGWLNIENG